MYTYSEHCAPRTTEIVQKTVDAADEIDTAASERAQTTRNR